MLPVINTDRCIGCFQCVRACPMGVLGKGEGHAVILPRRRCIECMHCASICPKKAVEFEGLTEEELYRSVPENPIEKAIVSRRSVRKFKTTLPRREDVQWALDTAGYAPSGKNRHDNRWTVLWGREVTDEITQMVLELCQTYKEAPELPKLFAMGTNLITCDAPCMIIAWSPDNCLNPVKDAVVAMSEVEMLLNSRGIATCWGGYLNQLTDRSPELRQKLGIPEGCNMRCGLMVGFPDRENYRNIPYRPTADAFWVEKTEE